jgi:N-acetyl-anhydromuramyl-L-alanine amidase AmpD
MKYGDTGPEVTRLQEKLIRLGYPLPRWGADGSFGDETLRAFLGWAADQGTPVHDEDFDGDFENWLTQWANALSKEPDPALPSFITDVTELHPIRNAYKTPRKLSDISAIVLHQTACHLGTRVKRWHSLPAHIGIPKDGRVILVNKLSTVCWHANYFNRFSVGIEIDGNFRGVEDDPKTLWKPGGRRSELTREQVEGAQDAIAWICNEVENHGGEVTTILAHRQTSKNRRADPGSDIWKRISLWAQNILRLTNDPTYTKGSGLPIPKQWDSRSDAEY